MPETLHPGLYIQEIPGNPPIEAVSTSTAAFVGTAVKGAIDECSLITNWNQFVSKYGSYDANSYLAYAVRAFFENGGSRCYVSRVVHKNEGVNTSEASTGSIISDESTPTELITVDAINDGIWGDNIKVEIANYDVVDKTFDVKISYKTEQVELFEEVVLDNIEGYINNVSNYIKVTLITDSPETVTLADQTVQLSGGNDGLADITDSDYIGDSSEKSGLYAFDTVSVNIVAIPGIATTAVHQGIVAYVEGRKDCFGVLDMPLGKTPATALTYKNTEANLSSENCALYYPWIYANDPAGVGKSPRKLLPPSGYVAGIYARIDNARGVWKAPAGTDTVVLGALDLEYKVNNAEQDTLNPNMINVVRSLPGNGICLWGTRTLKKGDYTYIPVRRTNTFIESSLLANLSWAVFEPNDEVLWNRIKTVSNAFLGGIKSNKGIKDFFVVCDDTINTKAVVDAGLLYVDIGVANQKPAEFIVFRLSLI